MRSWFRCASYVQHCLWACFQLGRSKHTRYPTNCTTCTSGRHTAWAAQLMSNSDLRVVGMSSVSTQVQNCKQPMVLLQPMQCELRWG
jgi:hypothetical protein